MKTCNACNQKKPLTEFYSKTAQCASRARRPRTWGDVATAKIEPGST